MKARGLRPADVRRGAGLLGLVGVLYVASRTSGAGWLVVLMCSLVGVVVVSAAWSLATIARARLRVVDGPADGTVGRPAAFVVEVGPTGPGLQLRLSVAGGAGPSTAAVAPDGVGRGRLTALPQQRGVWSRAVVEIQAGGPLGLWGWTRRVLTDLPGPLEVGPSPAPVRWTDQAVGGESVNGTRARARVGHDTYRGVRAYESGDPLRLVHWPATARLGQPMVREVEELTATPVVVAVDLTGRPEPAELAASLAAGLAGAALGAGRDVVLHTAETSGPRQGAVRSPVQIGRRLARAVQDRAPGGPAGPGVIRVSASEMEGDTAAHAYGWAPSPGSATGRQPRPRETLAARLRRVNARLPGEDSLALRMAVLVALMAAAISVLSQQVGGAAFRVAVLAGLPLGMAFSWRTRHRPGGLTKIAVAGGAVLALGWFLHTLAGITAGTVADAQTPLAELVLAIQVLHSFDATSRRDLLFAVFVSVLVVAAAGILSVSMALLPYLVVWGLAALAALVLAHRGALHALPALTALGPGPASRAAPGSHIAEVVGALLLTLVVGLAAFVVAPAAGTARALTFPAALTSFVPVPAAGTLANPSLGRDDPAGGFGAEARAGRRVPAGRSPFGYFGFSTSLDLALRGRPDNTLVMRVRADRPAMWRAQTFDVWNGRSWTMSSQRALAIRGSLPLDVLEPAQDGGQTSQGPDFVQSYYIVEPGPNLVFGADPVTQVYLSDHRVEELSDGTLRSDVELGPGTVYTVVSRPPIVTPAGLRRAGSDGIPTPPAITRRYASPVRATARVRKLAASVAGALPTTYDKVVSLEAWIGAHTRYSLYPPPLPAGADAVDRFLFVDHVGFCEQIATSLVVMLRSLGVPSRLAVGYAAGLRNPFTGLFEVHASDAHAWAEVWFPGIGWEPFDPTAQVPLSGQAAGTAATGLSAYLSVGLRSVPVPAAAGIGAVLILPVVGPLAGRRLASRRRRRRASGPVPAPSWAARCQMRLEEAGAARGRPRRTGETVHEYVSALDRSGGADALDTAGPLGRAASIIERAAFSASSVPDQDARWVEQLLDELMTPS